ncbi:hypothetical protein [Streptomyces sp. NBC_00102]|uniref:hypothetical protein n=1 Tax=Streptomyces sp. NBC_00102 TaxID=2975652 RepID=UPI0022584BFB|nr:hypothetical protein [Streptomyces sp. NBC_00102]MCX5400320.1 hypothetical protein [Streptomyces sp. NBC_00102]
MTASADLPRADRRAAAALCALFASPADLAQPGVREPAERARELLRSAAGSGTGAGTDSGADDGAGTGTDSGTDAATVARTDSGTDAATVARTDSGAAELAACYDALDTALRRAGEARGLVTDTRSVKIAGIVHDIKVAVCPGPVQCTRVERARDLFPAPPCAVNGTRMRKRRLGPDR